MCLDVIISLRNPHPHKTKFIEQLTFYAERTTLIRVHIYNNLPEKPISLNKLYMHKRLWPVMAYFLSFKVNLSESLSSAPKCGTFR